jgi:hypothetical protein
MSEWGFFECFKNGEGNLMGLLQTPNRQKRRKAPHFLTTRAEVMRISKSFEVSHPVLPSLRKVSLSGVSVLVETTLG